MARAKEPKTTVGNVYGIITEMVGYGEDIKECTDADDGLILKFKDKTAFKITVTEITKKA